MRHRNLLHPALLLLVVLFAEANSAALGQTSVTPARFDCAPVLARMKADIARHPDRIILATEDALATHEVCACPIIRTAVNLAGSDPALISRILLGAISIAPASAALLTQCVLREAPEAADAIRVALTREMGPDASDWLGTSTNADADAAASSEGPAGKVPIGKIPVALPPMAPLVEEESFGVESFYPAVGFSGVYVASTAPGNARVPPPVPIPSGKATLVKQRPPPRRPVSPVTRSIPD